MSVVSPEQLTLAVMTQDDKTITMAQGVGKKLAQRIILELKDKLGASQLELNTAEFCRLRRAGARQQGRGGDRRACRPRLFADGGGGSAQGH